MNELTKEYFENLLDSKLGGLATKKDLSDQINGLEGKMVGLETRLVAKLVSKKEFKDSIDELGRMVARGFDDIQNRLDVRDRVDRLEIDMSKIKGALNLA